MANILVSGSLAYDRIMDFPGFFRDHFLAHKLHSINVSFGVDGVAENFGGTAGNIAYNLKLLKLDPQIIATAGSDFVAYKSYLDKLGISTAPIRVDPTERTSAAYIITDKADNQIAAFSFGAGKTPYGELPEIETPCAIIGAGNLEDMIAFPRGYTSRKIRYFYDPAQALPRLSAEDLRYGIENSAGLFGNDYEIELIMQKTGWNEKDMLAKVPFIVATLGESGSRIVSKEGAERVDAVHVRDVVDPTGAGDAYRAGFIAAYLRSAPLRTCAKLGSAVAAYVVEKQGTQNHSFTLPDLRTRFEVAYGERFPL